MEEHENAGRERRLKCAITHVHDVLATFNVLAPPNRDES